MKSKPVAPVWAEIDLDRLCHNLETVAGHLKPGVKIMAVVKGNAYGHGALEVAAHLEQHGIDFFAVANVNEGVQLRRSGIRGSILLFDVILPEQIDLLFKYDLTPTVYDLEIGRLLAKRAEKGKQAMKYHLLIDTGNGGLGILPRDFGHVLQELESFKYLELEGIYTHLTSDYRGDDAALQAQIASFNRLLSDLGESGVTVPYVHMASSLAILSLPETHFNMVRAGILLYGIPPAREFETEDIQPVMQIKSRIGALKRLAAGQHIGTYHSKIEVTEPLLYAVIPMGYADAHYLLTTLKGQVLIRGWRAPIIGCARMNQMLVDVTHIPEAAIGDEVVLIGEQGEARITAGEVTAAAGIADINCESVCLVASRVPRVYLQEDQCITDHPVTLERR